MNKNKIYNPLFSLPAIILYTIIFIIPVIVGVGISLTDWNAAREEISFVGFGNYKDIAASQGGPYLASIIRTLIFTVGTVIGKVLLGLGLALLLNQGLKGIPVLRSIYFLPNVLAPLIIGITFVAILEPGGPFNTMLENIGLGKFAVPWLNDIQTALGTTMVVEIWRMAGWNMMILTAGLQMIPKEYYEASSMDGAGRWKQFVYVTLPSLRSSLMMVTVLNTIHGLRVFDIIYSLTGGGPGTYTEVINTQVFKEFGKGNYGMANALTVVMCIFTFGVSFFMRKALTGKEAD